MCRACRHGLCKQIYGLGRLGRLHVLRAKKYNTDKSGQAQPPMSRVKASVFNAARMIVSSTAISTIPQPSYLPEIIVTGRANVGKSSLLNALVNQKNLLSTSKKAGHTRALNFYCVGPEPGKFVMVDAPGYGARGKREWGRLFDHYIQSRLQLKRLYILFNMKHGLNEYDKQMLAHLAHLLLNDRGEQRFTLQAVITKADSFPAVDLNATLAKIKSDIWDAAPLCLPPIVTSAHMNPPFGIDALRQNIASVCNLR